MLVLINGSHEKDNIDRLYSYVSGGLTEGRHLIIVPETDSHRAERAMLEACGNRGAAYASVTTLTRLSERVLASAGIKIPHADKSARIMLMHKAVRAVQPLLEYHAKAARRTDMLAGLIDVADELKSSGITPEEFLTATSGLSQRLKEMAVIYSAYCGLCQGLAVQSGDLIKLAVPYAAQHSGISGANVYLYGFDGFTAIEYTLLEQIMALSSRTVIAIKGGEDEALFMSQIKTKGRLVRMAEAMGQECRIEAPPENASDKAKVTAYLAKALFDYASKPFAGAGGAVTIYGCKTISDECDLIAASCRRLVLEEGARLRDIAVVSAGADEYQHHMMKAFFRYGVPLYVARKESLISNPPAVSVVSAMKAVRDSFGMDSMLAYIKSGFAGAHKDGQERLENYLNTWHIAGSKWAERWTMSTAGYDLSGNDEALLNEINELRERVFSPLAAFKAQLSKCGTGREFSSALLGFIKDIELERSIEERIAGFKREGREQEGAEYSAVYAAVENVLAQLEEVFGEEELSYDEFVRLTELALSQYEVGSIPMSLDSVELTDFMKYSFKEIKYLFVAGAREGLFPPGIAGNGLLRERDRLELEGVGIELNQSDTEKIFESQSHIYSAIDSAVNQIYFTYADSLPGGEASRRSYLLERVIKLFPGLRVEDGAEKLRHMRLTAPIPAFEYACLGAGDEGEDCGRSAFEYYSRRGRGEYLQSLAAYSEAPRGPIASPANVSGLYGREIRLSASRAEMVSSCRFAYFMQYGLKAKLVKRAQLEAVHVGSMVHYVIENAVKKLLDTDSEGNEGLLRETVKYFAGVFVEDNFAGKNGSTARQLAVFAMITDNLIDIVRDILEELRRSDFRPLSYEMDFGGEGGLMPLSLKDGETALRLTGKIDRVDGYIKDDVLYVKVADYKTGNKAFNLSDLIYGINMQMFIYLMMISEQGLDALLDTAEKQLGKRPQTLKGCAALYIPAKTPYASVRPGTPQEEIDKSREKKAQRIGVISAEREIIEALEHPQEGNFRFLPLSSLKSGELRASQSLLEGGQLQALINKTRSNLINIARLLGSGDIEATPYQTDDGKTDYCKWCDYRPACQFDSGSKRDQMRKISKLKKDELFARLDEEGM